MEEIKRLKNVIARRSRSNPIQIATRTLSSRNDRKELLGRFSSLNLRASSQTTLLVRYIFTVLVLVWIVFGSAVMVKAQAPVGYWKFDETTGTTASDSSGNGNNGTLTNGPTWTTGKSGSALSFDGVDDYVKVNDSSSLQIANDITIEVWAKPKGTQGSGFIPLISKGTPGSWNGYHLFVDPDNTLTAYVGLNNRVITYDEALPIGEWTHVALVNEGTQNKIYINGVLKNATNDTGNIGTDNYELQIGGRGDTGPDRGYFNGYIDEVKIYNYARTATQIASDANMLVAYWNFDEGSGITASDSSGNGNNGTLTNGPTWTTYGQYNGALSFDGVDDYVHIDFSSALQLGSDYTISFWFKTQETAPDKFFIYLWKDGIANNRIIVFYHGVNFAFYQHDTSDKKDQIGTSSLFNDGAWHHFSATKSGTGASAMKMYVDGNLLTDTTILNNDGAGTITIEDMEIGRHGYSASYYTALTIDEVKIYNYARTATEIASDAQKGDTTPPSAPTNLLSTAKNGSVDLSWTANTEGDLHSYNVYRSTSSAGTYTKINQSPITTNQYTDSSVSNGVTYYYKITAVDTSSNESSKSSYTIAKPGVYPPPSSGVAKIAFASFRDGNEEIYIMNADGTAQTRLTNNSAQDGHPSVSADGTKITFQSIRDGNWEVYIMNSDGTNQTNLTNNSAYDLYTSFSPDGTKIVFVSDRDGNREIYIMNVDGTAQTRLTNNSAWDGAPSFTPDGTKIAFHSNRDGNYEVYVMNVDGTNQIRLTNNSADDSYPSFSTDGTKITFSSYRDGNYEVYSMNADGTNQTNLTNNSADDADPFFSADGTKIVFQSDRDGNWEVYSMNADGTGQTNLTNNSANDWHPAFSGAVFETTSPTSTITAPANNSYLSGTSYNITGTATDGTGSGVNKVEVSTDGGTTWNLATGTTSWSYSWTLPADGSYTIKSRALDNDVNMETSVTGVIVTVDNTSPTLSGVSSGSLTDNSAVISWTTNESADSTVEYGIDTSYGSLATDSNYLTNHSIGLSGLSASTTYHYRVKSSDSAGNESISGDYMFTTTTTTDTTPPAILSVSSINVTATTATITWLTDEASDSRVDYGTTTSYGSVATNANMTTSHSINLTGLTAGQTYHYKVTSSDASTNSATTGDYQFTTSAADTTPPTISAISSGTPTSSSATISWTTDEDAVCNVDYGTTTSYGASTSYETTYTTSHSISLSGLSSSTTYNYKLNCKDASSNASSSTNQTFTTTAPSDTTAPVLTISPSVGNKTSSSAIIVWGTDEVANSAVYYGTTTSYGLDVADYNLSTNHSIGLSGLSASTTYHYKVCSMDAYGNGPTCSTDQTFQTSAAADTTAPVVDENTISSGTPTSNSAAITFNTDELSVCLTKYGSTTSYGSTSAYEGNYVTTHSITLAALSSSTTYHFSIVCKDASGNTSSGTTDKTFATAVAADTTPPQSSVQKLLETQSAKTFVVYWSGTDNQTQNLVYDIQYKDGWDGVWVDFSTSTTSTWKEFTGENGHTYYFRSRGKDEAGNVEDYPTSADSYTSIEYSEAVNAPKKHTATIWGMISFPVLADDATPQAVLGDNVKNEDLQLYFWNPNKASDATWAQYQFPTSIELGQGYWLFVNTPVTIDAKGKPWKQNVNFEKHIYSGWNMVGDPFLYTIDWKNVQFRFGGETKDLQEAVQANWIENYIYSYNANAEGKGDWSQAVYPNGLLEPWVGYYIKAQVEGDLIFQPIESAAAKSKSSAQESVALPGLSWQWQIKAGASKVADSYNFIGVSREARNQKDRFDAIEPPGMSPYLSVYFPHPEWGKAKGNYANDIRAGNENGLMTWEMEVATDVAHETITLRFSEIIPLPEGIEIRVKDLGANVAFDPRKQREYRYNSGNGGIRRFAIYVGRGEELPAVKAPKGPVSLADVYIFPNPISSANTVRGRFPATFRYKVGGNVKDLTIEVYNARGRMLEKLRAELDGDTIWTGAGQLSNGVYFYRLVATDAQGKRVSVTKKLVVLR